MGVPVAKLLAVQLGDAVASGGYHAFDLVVFAFGDGHQQGGGRLQYGFLRGNGFVVVVQQHAVFQAAAQGVVGGVFERDAVDFWRLCVWGWSCGG